MPSQRLRKVQKFQLKEMLAGMEPSETHAGSKQAEKDATEQRIVRGSPVISSSTRIRSAKAKA
jgi:hypothetical protein